MMMNQARKEVARPSAASAPRILIVEDESDLALLLSYNLEAEGYVVESVARGDEAELRLAENAPDLVILDWMLPGVSGLEICRRLRARDVWERDADLDALEDSVFRDLLTHMMEDPRNITFCAHLLFCSKNIERIGDHATNIGETVFYLVTGSNLPNERPRGRQETDIETDAGEEI